MRAAARRQRVRHRSAAGAAADDDDVVAFGGASGGGFDAGVDLVHEPLILDRALEAHLGRAVLRGSIATKSRYIA